MHRKLWARLYNSDFICRSSSTHVHPGAELNYKPHEYRGYPSQKRWIRCWPIYCWTRSLPFNALPLSVLSGEYTCRVNRKNMSFHFTQFVYNELNPFWFHFKIPFSLLFIPSSPVRSTMSTCTLCVHYIAQHSLPRVVDACQPPPPLIGLVQLL